MTNDHETDEQRQERTGLSSLEIADAESAAVQKTSNRVTLASMQDKIVGIEMLNPEIIPHMTICVLLLENGFAVIGKSAPADPENYDAGLGEKFAHEDALRQMWSLEAYLLRERMTESINAQPLPETGLPDPEEPPEQGT